MIGCPALSPKQLQLSLKHLTRHHALRNRAIVILGVRFGLRISEILALRVPVVQAGRDWPGDTRNVVRRLLPVLTFLEQERLPFASVAKALNELMNLDS
jgi:integrase